MKNTKKITNKIKVILFVVILFLFSKGIVIAQCPTVVTNGISCQGNITIEWYFEDIPSTCPAIFPGSSNGTQVIPWNTSFTITCPGGSCGPLCNFYIRATIGASTSPWLNYNTIINSSSQTGKAYVCPGVSGTCCDFGTILFYDPVNGKAWVN